MKHVKALFFSTALICAFAAMAVAQETEAVFSSNLVGVSLPANAQRVLPNAVPAEINDALDNIIASGEGKLRKGGSEVLIWSGGDYRKANATAIIERLAGSLKGEGWQYSVEGTEDGVTVFSLFKEAAQRRAVLGFYGITDEALVFAWMEVLSANSATGGGQTEVLPSSSANVGSSASGNARDIVGTWTNGNVSMISEKNLSTGQISSRGGSTFKYEFGADGSFAFIGLMNSTVYGCTTSLFNDKRGKYSINGDEITFIPSKNFWRNQYSCSPASNKEKNHTLEPEKYKWRTTTDEYGKQLVCLANDKGESCYRRE